MCGVNGAFAYRASAASPSEREVLACRDHMYARGPDGEGLWFNVNRRVALAHRRLSIIDLSEAGHQPMLSANGQLAIVFNGEIYNYRKLRHDLEAEGCVFRSGSDTEVLLHLYARRGEAMLADLQGMFAFAIWDEAKGGLLLARDPYGIKPLYVSDSDGVIRFASQVKALLAGGGIHREPDAAGTLGFLLWGAVPEPFTLYRDIRALPAGSSQWIDADGPRPPRAFFDLPGILRDSRSVPGTAGERATIIREAVFDSVARHLVADVEVGVFLSAGIDSGAILGLMRDAGQSKPRGITLRFEEFVGTSDDESIAASEVAQLYGAEHHIRTVGETEFRADLPALLSAMDQPSIDGVNTWFVAKAAREQGLKVALSGVGGDELLGGYPSFRDIPRWARWLKAPGKVPGLGVFTREISRALMPAMLATSPKLAGLLEYGGSFEGAYLLRRGLFLPFELHDIFEPNVLRDGFERLAPLATLRASLTPDPGSNHGRVTALESLNYLKNQLLRDADWAGMAHSLEIRTPLVDSTLLRRIAPLVADLSIGEGKSALACAPSKPMPRNIAERSKTGFNVPTNKWRERVLENSVERPSDVPNGLVSRAWAREVLQLQAETAQ